MSKKIKVGLVTSCIDNRQARGTALVARRFLEQLQKYQDEFEFTLIHQVKTNDVIYKQWPEIIMPQINWPVGKTMLNEAWGWLKLRRQGIKFDIFHYLQPRVWPSYLLAPANKIIVNLYEGGVMLDLYKKTAADLLFRFTNRYLHQRMHAIIALSSFGREEISKFCFIPLQRIHVIPCGIDATYRPLLLTDLVITNLLTRYGIKKPYLLSVNRLDPHKNIIRLLRAYKMACQHGIKEYLVIVGGMHIPYYSAKVKAEITSLNLTDQVIMTPYITEEDLPKVYSAATALIFPSLHEGFGLPVIEAMACGLPVVTSNATSLPEVSGGAAFLFNPYNINDITLAIVEIINNVSLREKLRGAGFLNAKKYTWESGARSTVEIYKSLIKSI